MKVHSRYKQKWQKNKSNIILEVDIMLQKRYVSKVRCIWDGEDVYQ